MQWTRSRISHCLSDAIDHAPWLIASASLMHMRITLQRSEAGKFTPDSHLCAWPINCGNHTARCSGRSCRIAILTKSTDKNCHIIRAIRQIKDLNGGAVDAGRDFIMTVFGHFNRHIYRFWILVNRIIHCSKSQYLLSLTKFEPHHIGDNVAGFVGQDEILRLSLFIACAANQHTTGAITHSDGATCLDQRRKTKLHIQGLQ